jgi:alpha-L-fucosidase
MIRVIRAWNECRLCAWAALFLAVLDLAATAQIATYRPAASNLAARRAFQDDKFGMFIHWGVYSVLGEGEWVMQNKKIPISEYEKLPLQFNPVRFNAADWVSLAKAAGMKYIVITSKHHDGFAMFDSHASDWTIVRRTPWKQDPLKA